MSSNVSIKFMSFSSGSCGNSYFLSLEEDGKHTAGVMIDAGVSLRRIKKELKNVGHSVDSFEAILVTHDHMDHIRNLGSLCKHLGKPVYATPELHRSLAYHTITRDWIGPCRKELSYTDWNVIVPDKILVKYFVVPHDATQTVGYALWIGGYKFVIMTDIGEMTPEALAYAGNADTVVIESNYDKDMLLNGPYPYELKVRICQGCGHLSNSKCADAVTKMYHKGLKNIFLCHLSENNNEPEIAFKASAEALESIGFKRSYDKSALFFRNTDEGEESVKLYTLPRQTPSNFFTL